MQYDKSGLIVTLQNDGGDTCAEEGRFWFLVFFNEFVMRIQGIYLQYAMGRLIGRGQALSLLEVKPGIYVRNPNDYPNPDTVSRDQLVPIIHLCGITEDYYRLWRLFLACLRRGMFAQNWRKSDGTFKIADQMFTTIGYFIRSGGHYTYPLYLLLVVFDCIELLGNILWLVFPYEVPTSAVWSRPRTWFISRSLDDVDDNNTDIAILAAVAMKPTPFSLLNRLIWGQFRPVNRGNLLGIQNNCLAAIAWYHSPINQGNAEVIDLYKPGILKYMRKL